MRKGTYDNARAFTILPGDRVLIRDACAPSMFEFRKVDHVCVGGDYITLQYTVNSTPHLAHYNSSDRVKVKRSK